MPKDLNRKNDSLQNPLSAKKSTRASIILDISDESIVTFLTEAASYLDIAIVSHLDYKDVGGYDAIITDGKSGLDLVQLVQQGIVPILFRGHPLIQSFREFDPMKFEGNAFIYESVNIYLIFEKLVRYLENIRYAGDKRTLLNNVNKTF